MWKVSSYIHVNAGHGVCGDLTRNGRKYGVGLVESVVIKSPSCMEVGAHSLIVVICKGGGGSGGSFLCDGHYV